MRILIHSMNSSLFPDADLNSTTWTGPPPVIVTVQSLLYASLTTSLFAAFLAMLGKQWVNRYLRNRGGSAADKSRDRQQKLDGFKKWHFHLAIESLPVMLQLALLLLGCALSRYLWTISRTVAGVITAVTLFGVTSYVFLTLAAILYYNCPYQTPPSILTRTAIRYLIQSDTAFARSLRSITASLSPIKSPTQIFGYLRSGVHGVLESLGCIPTIVEQEGRTPLALVTPPRIFGDVSVDWEICKADIRCISWVLSSTTDSDVIYSTVRFAADMIWYPEIAGALSPHILAALFFDCFLDGRVVPGKSEHASSIGMALASVLSTQLTMEPEDRALGELCGHIRSRIGWVPSSDPTFMLVVATLKSVADIPIRPPHLESSEFGLFWCIPDHPTTKQKLWLSRIVLQTLWRWRAVQKRSARVLGFHAMGEAFQRLATDDDPTLTILKTNCFLTMAICLGLRIHIHNLDAPNNECVVFPSFSL